MITTLPKLIILVPCKNEEAGIYIAKAVLLDILERNMENSFISKSSKICFIDDGSTDSTWDKIKDLSLCGHVSGIKLSRNFGHQNALMAGLSQMLEYGDIFITIDADLQDDPEKINDFILEYLKGCEIVYGVRDDRTSDTVFKKNSALIFYKLQKLLGINTIENHADFRLMSQRAVKNLLLHKEPSIFLRGIIPMLGFKSTIVKYVRKERTSGETKYPLFKMVAFALDGITSFSIKPLRLITLFGFLFFFISFIGILWVFFQKIFGHTIEGWSSLMFSIYLSTGIQMISIGIIGEYVGKTFLQTKNRPNFIIEETIE